ncbi:type II toxin-antitoxin system RelE/ParE family toxin [Halomicronema sp. CCY15110]|uniref:type II toxin-antitoxin system RelE/ParE family toxin n=1 Tax=Halomicronema sp. CCY15110 TaxID=2767773 RepID=UPI0035CCCBD2
MKPVNLHSEAMQELDDAVAYYQEQAPGLGLDFLDEVEQALKRIQHSSNLGQPYKNTRLRRYVLRKFPFLIFYTELDTLIWVVAIAHAKRKPDYWRTRQIT